MPPSLSPPLPLLQSPLPFAAFLDELRRRGIHLGVKQYQDLAELCIRFGAWPGCDTHVMAQALGALLGNDREQALEIERLFFERHAEAFQFSPPDRYHGRRHPGLEQSVAAREAARAHQSSAPRRYRLVVALAIVMVSCGVLALLALREGHRLLVRRGLPPSRNELSPSVAGSSQADVRLSPAMTIDGELMIRRPLSPKPDPVRINHRIRRTLYGIFPSLLIGIGLYLLRRSKQIERFRQSYWNQRRAALPGPVDFCLRLGDLRPPLNRDDLDDMATVLGRSNDRPAYHELDGAKSVLATLERGLLPTLVFSYQAAARHLVVLCDVSREMRIYAGKVDALVNGLLRRGVRLSRYNFDGDASRVMLQLDNGTSGPSLPLSQLLQHHPEGSLLVVSLGRELRAISVENPYSRALLPWLALASRFHYRAWLHPLSNRRTWNPLLLRGRFPLPAFPMTRKGLLAAAYELAMDVERRLHVPQSALLPRRTVTQSDVQSLRRIVALFPSAPLPLAELLRQKFFAEVPDDVLLPVWLSSQDISGHTLVFGARETTRLLAELRASESAMPTSAEGSEPRRVEEGPGRDYLLAVLGESEPPGGSLGHLRWQLARALVAVGLRSNLALAEDARKTLLQLQQGPIYDEAKAEAVERGLPIVRGLAESADEVRMTSVNKGKSRAVVDYLLAREPGGWLARPQLGEVVSMLLVASLAAWAIRWRSVGIEEYQHLRAYHLERSTNSAQEREFTLYIRQEKVSPRAVELCADSTCRSRVQTMMLHLPWGATQTFKLPRPRQDSYYHVQAPIGPGERVAYSDELLIPGWRPPPASSSALADSSARALPRITAAQSVAQIEHGQPEWTQQTAPALKGAEHGEPSFPSERPSSQPTPFDEFRKPSVVSDGGSSEIDGLFAAPPHALPFFENPLPPPTAVDMGPLPSGLVKSANQPERMVAAAPQQAGRMVWIAGGKFQMGSDLYANERPIHTEEVKGFWMDQTEVTELAYRECVTSGGCSMPGSGGFCTWGKVGTHHHPINCVTWFQAEAYCRWAGRRLPTEAEWEYAARSPEGRKYPWGNSKPRGDLICWNRPSGTCEVGQHRVGDTPGSGLRDMAGNVWEWVDGWYCDEGYETKCQQTLQAIRGGSWLSREDFSVCTTNRGASAPMAWNPFVGFRCCVNAE